MHEDIDSFLQVEYSVGIKPLPEGFGYLKDLVKILIIINIKNKSCDYLALKLNFEAI
jgi:hypothetical protein